MPDTSQRFDAHIPQRNADVLKKMLPAYGGRSTMRKDECIEFLLTTLADPQRMKQVVASLEPFEKVGLALVKQAGGSIKSASLGIGILASGVDIPKRLLKRDAINDIASHMVTRGLLFHRDRYSSSYGDGGIIFSDPRILAHVGPMEPIPLMMEAANQPSATVVRMPPTVVLEIIGFLQTLENIGRLGTTKRGDLRDNDVRKFQKALQWPDGTLDVDGLPFHHAIHGLIQALSRSDFLKIPPTKNN